VSIARKRQPLQDIRCKRTEGLRKYQYLYGPVPSRRFGRSLGVDLIPHKTCSQDCIFCQLGRTTNKTISRQQYVPIDAVLAELEGWLRVDGKADYITLSGSGEPTLHSDFGHVFEFIRSRTRIPAVLLTSGSMLWLPEVRSAASHAHIVKVSLSAWDQNSYNWVNRPHSGLDFNGLVEGQKAFRSKFKGELWMEVFLMTGINSSISDVCKIAALARQIGPDRIHLNTSIRPPAEDFAAALSTERLGSLVHLFHPVAEVIAVFDAKERVETHATKEEIHAMLLRRPCTAWDIAKAFGMHVNEVFKYLGDLLQEERIRSERINRSMYYTASSKKDDSHAHL